MENQFRQYPLEEDILGALDALGYTQPTEIQAAVIPSILNGRDNNKSAENIRCT